MLGSRMPAAPSGSAELNLINLNVTSSVRLAKRVLPDMVNHGRGRVLFTSSIAATAPGPFQANYAASKAFLYSFAEAIREELKGTGVTVTALLPGPTDTNIFARAGMQDTRLGQASMASEPLRAAAHRKLSEPGSARRFGAGGG